MPTKALSAAAGLVDGGPDRRAGPLGEAAALEAPPALGPGPVVVALVGALAGHAEDVADVGPGGAGGAGLVHVVGDEVLADAADLTGDLGCGSEPVQLGARGAPVDRRSRRDR